MRVVFCASEATPYAKTGGLADVCGSLPIALKKENVHVSIIMPFYACVREAAGGIKKLTQDVFFAEHDGVDAYFIKNDEYFARKELYGDVTGDYHDNLQRFSFFNKSILKFFKDIQLKPDIFHCHDWQTSLVPVYLKTFYKIDSFYQQTKTILSIHNLAYQGVFSSDQFSLLGLPLELNHPSAMEFHGKLNFLKSGIIFSDEISTVSPTYAREITQKETGCGLEGVMHQRPYPAVGILNGIDYQIWNPKTDKLIQAQYQPDRIQGKLINKENLQEQFHLEKRAHAPIFGFVGRLSHQKGIDLLAQAMDHIAHLDAQWVFLGVGEERYHKLLESIQAKYSDRVGVRFDFDEKMAHQIYAGSDFFLMPSVYEPCGLSQMISFRYGTIPVVYNTGGLADTVSDFNPRNQKGDGIVFDCYQPEAFVKAFERAITLYKKKNIFHQLVFHIMHYDFSWETPAKEYKKFYQRCLS